MNAAKKAIVLVHGARGGGWVWRQIIPILRAKGHDVFALTLTGLADRSHLASADVNLTTHITDVVNTIKWAELDGAGIVLVGHSYVGTVISGVAEKVPEGTIATAVFLDAAVPDDGQCQYDYVGTPVPEPDGLFTPRQAGDRVDVPHPALERVRPLYTSQPYHTFTEPLRLTGARERIAKLVYVAGTANRIWQKRPQVAQVKQNPRWIWRELDCGHNFHIAMPEETAALLLEAAQD